jgi:uncharacterized protein involved in type VI secretion and phage assembly
VSDAAMNDQTMADLLERVRHRFYGKYRGTVTDNDDPNRRGRIRANVPAVLGEQVSGWCAPCVPYAGAGVGIAFLPEIGSGVWIEFEGGDVSYPIWSGCYWRDDELPEDVAPTVKVVRTVAGHQILLDDDGSKITVTDPNGNTVTLESSGITLERGANRVTIGDASVSVNDGALEVV